MKTLQEFIKEYYVDGEKKIIKSFKPNMIKGNQLIDSIDWFLKAKDGDKRKGLYLICISEDDKQHYMKFKYNDQGILVFKEYNQNCWYDWKNGISELIDELKTSGNDVYQFTFFNKNESEYLLEGDFTIEIQSDLNNYNLILYFYKTGKEYILNDD